MIMPAKKLCHRPRPWLPVRRASMLSLGFGKVSSHVRLMSVTRAVVAALFADALGQLGFEVSIRCGLMNSVRPVQDRCSRPLALR